MAKKERWASRLGLVLAMAGNAVGLGNFLRFPAQAAKNGGGAFLIPYFVALLLVGLPLIWVEWAMGRYGGQHGHHSAPGIFQSHSRNGIWKYFGVMGLWSCLVIASYYLYIETWCLAYAGYSVIGGFKGADISKVGEFFAALTGEREFEFLAVSPWGMGLFALCIGLNVFILSRGLAKGIELVSKIGMPLLIVFAMILAIRGLMIDPATDNNAKSSPMEGLNFVWEPRFDSLADPSVWLAAAGQIFFTLSIGMGSIHCYASYLREQDDVALTGATAGWTNEFCEVVLGGSILIPIAVAYLGLDEVTSRTAGGSGFSLGFFVFPTLFNNWGAFAPVAGLLWFGLLFFAAITSSLAMGQPIMAFLQQEFKLTRGRSAVAFGIFLLPLALPVAMLHSNTFNDELDYWAGTVMLVVFALGESILFAWIFGMHKGWTEMTNGAELKIPRLFFPIIKFITPVFLLLILLAFVFKPAGEVTVTDAKTGATRTEAQGWKPYLSGQFPKWEWASDGMIGKLLHIDVARAHAGTVDRINKSTLAVQKDPALSDMERAKKIAEQSVELTKAESFYASLPTWRNLDRAMMVGVYVFFALLVARAWKNRSATGGAA
jgi:SNF family Na+-dependent transporter